MPYKNLADRRANTQRRRQDPEYVAHVRRLARETWARRFAADPEKHRQKVRDWRAANIDSARAAARKATTKQRVEHSDRFLAHVRKAQTARLRRFPKWANEQRIQEVYATAQRLARNTGLEWHVDHVLPLQGRLVSGLHVHENLRVVPARMNLQKSNHFEVI